MKIITNAKITNGYQHWKEMFEANEELRKKYGLHVLAYGHPFLRPDYDIVSE